MGGAARNHSSRQPSAVQAHQIVRTPEAEWLQLASVPRYQSKAT